MEPNSWQVKDEAILPELVALMGVTPAESALLASLKDAAAAEAPALLKDFYDRLLGHENTAQYLQGVSMDRLHSMVADWFLQVFSGVYNEDYAKKRLVIGQIHVRIGLPVRYPLAMLDILNNHGEQISTKSSDPAAAVKAFRKLLALDVAIFNQAYEDNQLHHLSELVGGERLARRLLSGQ